MASMRGPVVVAFLVLGTVQVVADCMSGNQVMCFNCNSHEDPRCRDTFNWTNQPEKKHCTGCCVKMIQGIGTEDEKIRRSCTDDIDINLFLVDHVCMSEGGGKGKMCYCKQNECNGAEQTAAGREDKVVAVAMLAAPLPLAWMGLWGRSA